MKNITLIIILSLLSMTLLFAQESTFKGLTPFDKVIIEGNVEKVRLLPANAASPMVKVKGAAESNVTANVVAGILNLTIKDNGSPVHLEVFNSRLKRISGPEAMDISGAEVIGGESGNYLVVSFGQSHDRSSWAWAGEDFDVHIPDVDIDIPDIPDLPALDFTIPEANFDFEHLNSAMKHSWNEHKEEIRHWSREMNEEMKEQMKKAREQMEEAREQMEKAREQMKEFRKN